MLLCIILVTALVFDYRVDVCYFMDGWITVEERVADTGLRLNVAF